ncbi:MAG: hypothetical protein LBR65_07910 [Culturomica sp.]|jgi:hypothetical protein|nr:hypothetical protein [Culturomica sp.]
MRKMVYSCLWLLGSYTGMAQPGIQERAALCMERIGQAEADSVRIRISDELAGLLQQLPWGAYRLEDPVKFLGFRKEDRTGAEMFSWIVPLQASAACYHLFKFNPPQRDVLLRVLPGDPGPPPAYLFYDWVGFTSKGKPYYVLFGWSETAHTNRKGVWIAAFPEEGGIRFDHRLMRKGESRSASLTFEYSRDANMMLKHDHKGKRIVFDHLVPAEERFSGSFMFYGPDGSWDALVLKRGEWIWEENVKPVFKN